MIMVDADLESKFGYTNADNEIEYVEVFPEFYASLYTNGERLDVYIEDIPKLIKALQAAYTHAKGNK